MTTTPIHSITDEQIAEIEARALMYGESEFIRGIMNGAVLALITHLREAEKDAARYRWLRGSDRAGIVVRDRISHLHFHILDAAIDTAMQGDK